MSVGVYSSNALSFDNPTRSKIRSYYSFGMQVLNHMHPKTKGWTNGCYSLAAWTIGLNRMKWASY